VIEALSIIAGSFELIGLYLIGKKNRIAFLIFILGNICWITYVVLTSSAYGLLLACVPAIVLNARGYYLWKKSDA